MRAPLCVLLTLIIAPFFAGAGESYEQQVRIDPVVAGDTAPGDRFSWDVDLDGDFMVASSIEDDDVNNGRPLTFLTQPDSGSATVFRRSASDPAQWSIAAKLLPMDTSEQFGQSVAIDGDTIAIGAYTDSQSNVRSGTVYIFQRNQGGPDEWGLLTRIVGSPRDDSDQFGFDIDLQGDTLIVGAPDHDTSGSGAGSAYIFQRNQGSPNGWGQVSQLLPSSSGEELAGGDFGHSVALDADRAVVGAPRDNVADDLAGAVYVFERNSGGPDAWGEAAKLDAGLSAQSNTGLGYSVAISADRLIAGAQARDEAYLFELDGGSWTQVKRFESEFPGGESNFGDVVAIDGDRALVGDGLSPPDRNGTVYVYGEEISDGNGGGWGLLVNLYATDRNRGMDFGKSMAVDDGRLLVGAPEDDDFGSRSGSSYLFEENLGGPDAWGARAEINPGESGGEIGFGQSIAISGRYLFIAAPQDRLPEQNSGSVSVFKRVTGARDWAPLTVLDPSEIDFGDGFGHTIAAWGPLLLVGSRQNDGERGAHLFGRDQGGPDAWGEIKYLETPAGAPDVSVAIFGDTAALGDWSASSNASGTVYLFQKDADGPDNWGLLKSLAPSDGQSSDQFGWSVAMHEDRLIVGARNQDEAGNNTGAAYLFERDEGGPNNWGEVEKLLPSEPESGQNFGEVVTIFDDVAAIGAPSTGSRAGAVYVFQQNLAGDWVERRILPESSPDSDDDFGNTVSLWRDLLVVSSGGWDDDLGTGFDEVGAAFVYQQDAGGENQWGRVATLLPDDAQEDDRLTGRINSAYTRSTPLSIQCDVIAAGAPVKDTLNADVGIAYAFSSEAVFCGDFEP